LTSPADHAPDEGACCEQRSSSRFSWDSSRRPPPAKPHPMRKRRYSPAASAGRRQLPGPGRARRSACRKRFQHQVGGVVAEQPRRHPARGGRRKGETSRSGQLPFKDDVPEAAIAPASSPRVSASLRPGSSTELLGGI
jgi:hypothetical protein